MRPRSLRAILAIYVGLFLTGVVALRVFNYTETHKALEREVDRRLATEASAIVEPGNGASLAAMAARIAAAESDHDTADLYFMLTDGGGRRIAGKLNLSGVPVPGYSDFDRTAGVSGVSHGRALTRRVAGGGTLVVVSDNDVFDDVNSLFARIQLIGLVVTAMIAIGGAIGIYVAIRGRLRAMQETVAAVIDGDLHNRVPIDGSRSEFDRQAQSFNKMLDRIDELMGNIRHAAKDVTHELKSPLARLRTKVAAISRRAQGNPLAPDIAGTLTDIDRMLDLFSSLLRLWEIEGGHRRERFIATDLSILAAEVGETMQAVAEDSGHKLALDIADPVPIRGDVDLLRQMILNLLENALRHTPRGTSILLTTRSEDGTARMIVADNGPGIPAEHHEAVMRKFGRLETAGELAGQGLGLALVDAIARLHRGRLRLEDTAPGLRVVVELPVLARR